MEDFLRETLSNATGTLLATGIIAAGGAAALAVRGWWQRKTKH